MCGIAGFVGRGGATREAVIRRMTAAMATRGPDGDGFWHDEVATFGHRRLAVIDLTETGQQPMVSASGRTVITYNGEIYNAPALRWELEQAGHRFRGQSDTEVLLEACERWGTLPTLKRCAGMFAFALWDREARRLTLARDRIGIKPLYWTQQDKTLAFASTLAALRPALPDSPALDPAAFAAYVRTGAVPAPLSIYQDIYKLPPASTLTWQPGNTPEITPYWALRDPVTAQPLGTAEATDVVHHTLRESVSSHLLSDVPLGCLLSGGIDSTLVAALMQDVAPQQIKTFTVGFDDPAYDESPFATAMAHHLKTDHHTLQVTEQDALETISTLPTWYDEPLADSSQIPTALISRLAREHVTVVLSGDGGDEAFAGYHRHVFAQEMWPRLQHLPFRAQMGGMLQALSPALWHSLTRHLPPSLRVGELADKMRKLGGAMTCADDAALYAHLTAQWPTLPLLSPAPYTAPPLPTDLPTAQAFQYSDTRGYLPDDVLVKVDRASMAFGLEVRVPLLDHRVLETAWQVPQHLRIHKGQGKVILRHILSRYVPDALFNTRPKKGFSVPLDRWLRGPLRDWAEDLLSAQRLQADGLFDTAIIRQAWQDHLTGRRDLQYPLWVILMFQIWKAR